MRLHSYARRGMTTLSEAGSRDAGAPAVRLSARERILDTAYGLICRHGVRAVGIDTIIERSDVAKMTVYRQFGSKDELVLAVMERREQLWLREWLQAEVLASAPDGASRLLAIFDVFDCWFRQPDFEGCLFINVVLEIDDREHPINRAGREHLARIRTFLAALALDAGIEDDDAFARQWHVLMKGSIVAAGEGDVDAARRAQAIGRLLLADAVPSRR